MTEEQSAPADTPKADPERRVRDLAHRAESKKPAEIGDSEWRRARIQAGHMVIIRSHFKSIYLVPMSVISMVCGLAVLFFGGSEGDTSWNHFWGLAWTICFMFYMNIFIFEWNRAWTIVLIGGLITTIAIGFAIDQ